MNHNERDAHTGWPKWLRRGPLEIVACVVIGLFALISGLIALAGNVAAGLLWDGFGPQATFAVGAVLSLVCALGVAGWMRLQAARSRSSASE